MTTERYFTATVRQSTIRTILVDLTLEQAEQTHTFLLKCSDMEIKAIANRRLSYTLGYRSPDVDYSEAHVIT